MAAAYQASIKIQRWVLVLGILLLGIKFLAYFITGSVAILTDALESIVNVVAGFITLGSLVIAARPRDQSHPYGHGKAEFISAGIEGSLIMLAGIWIGFESVRKMLNPTPVQGLDKGLLLIAACGLINLMMGWIALQQGKKNNSMAVQATGRHLMSDAYSTAGLVGGLLLLKYTGWAWLDSAVAMLFGGFILFTGFKIVRGSIAGIMDEADETLLQELVNFLQKNRRQNWIDLHNLRVIKYGNRLHMDCHLTLPWYMNMHEAHAEIDNLGKMIKGAFGDSIEMFVHTDGCLPKSCALCARTDCTVRQHAYQQQIAWTIDNLFQNEKHSI